MPKVKNVRVAGQTVVVIDAEVSFDAEGLAEVSAAQAEHLSQIPFYEILAEEEKISGKKGGKKAGSAENEATDKE